MPAPTEKYSPDVKLAGRRASNSDTNKKSLVFLGLLWFSLLVAFGVLVVLLVTTLLDGIGRYDLPGGSLETLMRSIYDQVLTLPEDTVLYSGHGQPTTVAQERQHNPFLN
jgi:hypothetical protein